MNNDGSALKTRDNPFETNEIYLKSWLTCVKHMVVNDIKDGEIIKIA